MKRAVTVLAAALWLCACATHTLLSDADQQKVREAEQGKRYFLRYSFFVGPFFSYEDRLLVSERDFDERALVENLSGEPIFSASPQAVIPFGTPVHVKQVEFPTSSVVVNRRLKSPRHFTWVYLELEGTNHEKPLILVLTNEMRTPADFDRALENFLVKEDPRPAFASLPAEILQAVDGKQIVKGMRWDALLRSRGHPDRVDRREEGGKKIEKWFYRPDRWVLLEDGQVVQWEGFPSVSLEKFAEQAVQQ